MDKLDVFYSDDYAGLDIQGLEFYYGYEETCCQKHKRNCDCEDNEWAFTVRRNGKEIFRIGQSEIDKNISYQSPKDFLNEPYGYLLAGIGIWLAVREA